MGVLKSGACSALATRQWAAMFSASAILLATCAACAATPSYNLGHLPQAEMAKVESACGMVARLPDGSYYDYYVCEESLSRSLGARIKAVQIGQVRQDCLAAGNAPGSLPLSLCELGAAPTAARASFGRDSVTHPPSSEQGKKIELSGREKLACADIGLDPAEPTFQQCVADLDSDLFAARHPAD